MFSPLELLIACGTRLWLDSVDPELVRTNRQLGATGATSNPVIVSDLLKTGRSDDQISRLLAEGIDDEAIAWQMTDRLVRDAQAVFLPVSMVVVRRSGVTSIQVPPVRVPS